MDSLAPVSAKLPRLNRCYDVLAESVVGTNLAPNATSAKDIDTNAHTNCNTLSRLKVK